VNKILAIASNTFRETIRDKLLYGILFFSILLLFVGLLLGELSLGNNVKVTKDVGLSAISLFGILLAIFTGVSLVHKELDKRTIYTILSKPIHRHQFILGKYLGMLMTAFVQIVLLTLVFTFLLLYQQQYLDYRIYNAVLLYWFEIVLITSVALFFSSFTTPFFSGLFTFCFFLIGRLMPEVEQISTTVENTIIAGVLKGATLLPNLQHLNIGPRLVHHEALPPGYITSSILYATCYTGLFLFLAIALFSKRDLM
tara:strand:- start:7363 stop:8127 length:765 start_codon:yes stop_codon:yes gene_type:complete